MSFEEQIMSADKSLSIFWRQMEAIVIVATSTVLKIGDCLVLFTPSYVTWAGLFKA